MFRISSLFLLLVLSSAIMSRELFAENIGRVVVMRNMCSDMSNSVYSSFNNEYTPTTEKRRMVDLSTETSTEIKKLLQRDDVEEVFVDMKAKTVCISTPITYQLNHLLDGGKFSPDLNKFEYLDFPAYWISLPGQNYSNWQNINFENCIKKDLYTLHCSELDLRKDCEIGKFWTCGKIREMNSSNSEFAFSRQLSSYSHIIATRAPKVAIIENGNIFNVQTIAVTDNIFKACLENNQMMSVGTIVVKN